MMITTCQRSIAALRRGPTDARSQRRTVNPPIAGALWAAPTRPTDVEAFVRLVIVLALLCIAAVNPVQARSHRAAPTVVTRISYNGWPEAYRLSNGIVEMVVVPAVGRVMAYHFVDHPETDPLWTNFSDFGKFYVSHDIGFNPGGDKLWPSPQDDWGKHGSTYRNWPPDPAVEFGPYQGALIKNGLRITGPVSAGFAMSVSREFILKPGSAQVSINDTFTKSADASGDKNGFPVGIWNITETRADETVYVPLPKTSKVNPQGFIGMQGASQSEVNWTVADGLLSYTHHPSKSNKVGIDDQAGWMATLYGGDVLFSERSAYEPKGVYLDAGTHTQLYSKDSPAFIEIEFHSAGHNLKAGESMKRTVTWNLQRLPRMPSDSADARAMVKSAMRL